MAGRFRRRTGDDHYVVYRLRHVQHVGKCWLGQEIGCVGTALANGDAEEVSIPVCAMGGLAERSLRISHHVLELGVGGGNNLSHLTGEFDATAVDLSESMLANSIRLNRSVDHHVGDMRTVRLGRTFDAVLIHDAISYMLTEDDLRGTFATDRAHLGPAGVFVTAPDWYRETFPEAPSVSSEIKRRNDEELCFVEYLHDPDPSDTTVESIFLLMFKEGEEVRVEEDRHTTGLFPVDTWLSLITEAGFAVERRPYPVHADGHEAYLLVAVVQ